MEMSKELIAIKVLLENLNQNKELGGRFDRLAGSN